MSKFRADNIVYDENDFLVEIHDNSKKEKPDFEVQKKISTNVLEKKQNEILVQTQKEAQLILNKAQFDSKKVLDEAQNNAKEILDEAKTEAQKIKDEAKSEAQSLLEKAKEDVEAYRIEEAKRGYSEGHEDGLIKIKEELDDKLCDFDKFIETRFEIKEKVLNSLSNDILSLINSISKKVLLKELDASTLENIIKSAISKLEKKENITIILSEKYARLLFEIQKNKLTDDENSDFDFTTFNSYENFKVVYNPKFAPDTIIVENLKERLDSSVSSQLDIIIREIYDSVSNTPSGRLEFKDDEHEA